MSDIRLDGVSKRYGAVAAAEGKTDQDTAEAIEKRLSRRMSWRLAMMRR